eukprot:TRINITY_DN13696_c0_g1_i3.p1 TRINITY_DN13696_c0_g1~~TRINITY_DN13696_c0_g1_i3.p1  ORF type:complete len:963 (-),score=163.13 TRINITY_DN13696_c0_g1_i3:21-2633(-)
MGHVRVYTISDTIARTMKMKGYDVLHPMGWDAFGLPAENAAIERNTHPREWTIKNIAHMKGQLNKLNIDFNWDKELSTCEPDYYKWTQSVFLQLYHAGLAYQKEAHVNWDPVDMTVLANEQVDATGRSWRSNAIVERRLMRQWFFKITDYAQPLHDDLAGMDGWPEPVKMMQRSWIGPSKGALVKFKIQHSTYGDLEIFTTRPDTLFGVTFVALAPGHKLVDEALSSSHLSTDEKDRIRNFVENAKRKLATRDHEEQAKSREGVALGMSVKHPLTGTSIPIYVSEYVLMDYGTGAVMGVPAHDERDFEFATRHNLPIKRVVAPVSSSSPSTSSSSLSLSPPLSKAYVEEGVLVDSAEFSGMTSSLAREKIAQALQNQQKGAQHTQYRLRDWLISRQRYWGCPIPVVNCSSCGVVPVPEKDLPVILPHNFTFTGKGNTLSSLDDWINTTCPCCGGRAMRETDTMDTFVDSSWYFLRFPDSNNKDQMFNPKTTSEKMPVDIYIGGIEHAILHLLYARFITKVLYDRGLVTCREPFKALLTQGLVNARTYRDPQSQKPVPPGMVDRTNPDGTPRHATSGTPLQVTWEKMSKSKHNGIDPDDVVDQYGADTARLFILFKAPPENSLEWDEAGIEGCHRWLGRVNTLINSYVTTMQQHQPTPQSEMAAKSLTAQDSFVQEVKAVRQVQATTIARVTDSICRLRTFNTAVSELMKFSNFLADTSSAIKMHAPEYHSALCTLVLLLAPMAPGTSASLWRSLCDLNASSRVLQGHSTPAPKWTGDLTESNVHNQNWPVVDEDAVSLVDEVLIVVQVNGKVRANVPVSRSVLSSLDKDSLNGAVEAIVRKSGLADKYIKDKVPKKVIVANQGKIISFVI